VKRRQVRQSFAVHLLLANLATAVGIAIAMAAAILLPALVGLETSGGDDYQALGRHASRILDMHTRYWPVVLSCLVGVAVSSWWMYRRMTGPLARFRRCFRAAAEGRIPGPIRLRRSDYLTEDAELLNQMMDGLRRRLSALRTEREELSELIGLVADRAAGDSELAQLAEEMRDRDKHLEAELRFDLEPASADAVES
jgi:methyl-accepting chemotaxis protein